MTTAGQRRKIHLAFMGLWLLNGIVLAIVVDPGWELYLIEISIYANFATHWSGWSAETPVETEIKPE